MVLVPYPDPAKHKLVELRPVAAALVNRSALSNARQAVDLGYSWWEAVAEIGPMTIENARKWRLFFGRLRGPVHSFRLPVSAGPQHSGTFTVRAQGAGSGYSLVTDGWPVSSTVLRAGDYVTVGDQLMVLDQDVVSNASGVATLHFHSPLRRTVADNTVIETKRPFLTACLSDDAPARSLTLGQIQAGFSFSAMEAY